ERRDLHAFVLTLFRHTVREGTQYMFAILKFPVRLLESFAPEEHLPRKEKREYEYRDDPPLPPRVDKELCKHETKDGKTEVANHEFAEPPNPQFANDPNRIGSVVQARNNRYDSE